MVVRKHTNHKYNAQRGLYNDNASHMLELMLLLNFDFYNYTNTDNLNRERCVLFVHVLRVL